MVYNILLYEPDNSKERGNKILFLSCLAVRCTRCVVSLYAKLPKKDNSQNCCKRRRTERVDAGLAEKTLMF
ncbi:hypothetical protein TNCV_539091 [Trichonephila clavipes]|nr:hypothetical protein TNCV_539091 [Trichonephila clavipes]